jgi:hypothetical protein
LLAEQRILPQKLNLQGVLPGIAFNAVDMT